MKFANSIKFGMMILIMTMCTTAYSQNQNVEINTLTSEATPLNPPEAVSVVPSAQGDQVITDSINSHIKRSDTLSKLNIVVQTNQGVVMLSGTVDSNSQASALVELAQSVVGVTDVDAANLSVKESQQPVTDMMITAKIKGLFVREKVFGSMDIAAVNISVETRNGIVYLTGTIDNQEQIKNAIKIAEGVKGVTKVEYNVKKVMPVSDESVPLPVTNDSVPVSVSGEMPVSNGNAPSQ